FSHLANLLVLWPYLSLILSHADLLVANSVWFPVRTPPYSTRRVIVGLECLVDVPSGYFLIRFFALTFPGMLSQAFDPHDIQVYLHLQYYLTWLLGVFVEQSCH